MAPDASAASPRRTRPPRRKNLRGGVRVSGDAPIHSAGRWCYRVRRRESAPAASRMLAPANMATIAMLEPESLP